MLLDVRTVRATPGASLPFSFELTLSDMPFFGEYPLRDAVRVEGMLYNRAGMLGVKETVVYAVDTSCARCAKPLHVVKTLELDQIIADELQDDENDDILLIENDTVDAGEIARDAVIFDMDMAHLCREDCRGLCPVCGADLNEAECEHVRADEGNL